MLALFGINGGKGLRQTLIVPFVACTIKGQVCNEIRVMSASSKEAEHAFHIVNPSYRH